MNRQHKKPNESRFIKGGIVLPPDTNHHGTLFGGKLMAMIDEVATVSATRHCRKPVVTASTDSVAFINPVKVGDSICLESCVVFTGKSSMEVFVKAVTENLLTGERKVCATSFLTFVALGEDGKPTIVPEIRPETDVEKMLYDGAEERMQIRKIHRKRSAEFAELLGTDKIWER